MLVRPRFGHGKQRRKEKRGRGNRGENSSGQSGGNEASQALETGSFWIVTGEDVCCESIDQAGRVKRCRMDEHVLD